MVRLNCRPDQEQELGSSRSRFETRIEEQYQREAKYLSTVDGKTGCWRRVAARRTELLRTGAGGAGFQTGKRGAGEKVKEKLRRRRRRRAAEGALTPSATARPAWPFSREWGELIEGGFLTRVELGRIACTNKAFRLRIDLAAVAAAFDTESEQDSIDDAGTSTTQTGGSRSSQ